jgi:CBS domain-containing protein
MKAQEIMTSNPACCSVSDTLADAARHMRDHDCGAVPVIDHGCIVGIVTDRDLAVRALADGRNAETRIIEVMTGNPCCGAADDDLRDVETIMADRQVRRVPIVDADGCCVGMVSQADIARAAADGERVAEREIAIVLEAISEPERRRSSRSVSSRLEQPL